MSEPSDNGREFWSIQALARMSGVTARTLRYYHEIGLLPPAWIGANGYRYYRQPELLRLQEILLLRELGMDLDRIGRIVAGEHDKVEALRGHYQRLVDERDRLDRLAHTVADTIDTLRKGTPMAADAMFHGFRFTADTLADLEALERDRTGGSSPYYGEIHNRIRDWDEAAFERFTRDSAETEQRLLELLRAGVPCDAPAVFAVLADDLAVQRRLVSLDADSYVKLGAAFVRSPILRAHFDARDPRLAEYLRDAMVAYAEAEMR